MAATYPNSVKSWANKVDGVDDIMAAHINEAYDEIIAVETRLLDDDLGLTSKIPQNFSDATDETVLLGTDNVPLNKSDGTYKKISFSVVAVWILSTVTIALNTVAQNIKDAINELVGAVLTLSNTSASETTRNNAWNTSQDDAFLGELSDTIRQSAMISRTGTGTKNGVTIDNPISFKDSGARYEILGQTLTNLINGDFEIDTNSDGLANGFVIVASAGATFSIDTSAFLTGAKSQKIVTVGGFANMAYPFASVIGHKYYYLQNIKNNSANIFMMAGFNSNDIVSHTVPADNVWHKYTNTIVATGEETYLILNYQNYVSSTVYLNSWGVIDLGDSASPYYNYTAAQMDAIASAWFDGTVNVVNPVLRTVGKNLFDGTWLYDKYYRATGELIAVGGFFYSLDYIPIVEGIYTTGVEGAKLSSWCDMIFYDSDKQYISGYHKFTDSTFIAPANARYARVSGLLENGELITTFQLELGSVATAYEAFKSNSLALTGTLRSVVDTAVLYQDRLYNQYGRWYIDRYVNPADGLLQAMATEDATVTGIPYVYRDGMTIIETSVIAPLVDMKIPYADVNNTYVPTLTWTTATPTITTSLFRYAFKAGRCMIKGQCVMSNGGGATNLTITLPAPVRVGSGQSIVCLQLKINTTWSALIVQIIESTNLITFKVPFALTSGQAAEFEFYSEYEVA